MYEDKNMRFLISFLKKKAKENDALIWKRVAELIDRPRRRRIAVNISKINRYTQENDWVIIPGKVLGAGELDHPVNLAAVKYSEKAYHKLIESGSKIYKIKEFVELNPKGSGVKIIV